MSHYSGSVPDTLARADEWRESAACAGLGDLMFPDTNTHGIAAAKAVCRSCPAWRECLSDALTTGDNQWGVRGRLTDAERRTLTKQLTPQQLADIDAVAAAATQLINPATPQDNFRHVWEDRTRPLPDGHIGWQGSTSALSFRGRSYTPKQISFLLHRGHDPVGIVRRTCEVVECVNPLHLADNRDRHQAKAAAEREAAEAAGEQVAV